MTALRFAAARLDELIQALRRGGHTTIGPRVDGAAVVYDEIASAGDLPRAWGDEQEKGRYRLRRLEEPRYFGFNATPESWKKILQPSRIRLWQARRENGRLVFSAESESAGRLALIGVRACDLHAMQIQDRVRPSRKPFIVSVGCAQAAATCFCASMATGPELPLGSDIELTELYSPEEHAFVAIARTSEGETVLAELTTEVAGPSDLAAAEEQLAAVRGAQTRSMPATDLRAFLAGALESPHWDEVASRCLSCANCTLVCPTCFCTTTEDVTDLSGDNAERWLKWDSCFTLDFSRLHGGSVRQSTRARYRQWLTHKLGTWHDQFGSSGCVGCGRCIAWCPVGIDITEEVRSLQAAAEARRDPQH